MQKKISVDLLTGPALEWGVLQCKGEPFPLSDEIIQRDGITVTRGNDLYFPKGNEKGDYYEPLFIAKTASLPGTSFHGNSPLVAVSRCYIAKNAGPSIEVPQHLLWTGDQTSPDIQDASNLCGIDAEEFQQLVPTPPQAQKRLSDAEKYAAMVLGAYQSGQDNAFEVFQQFWPYDPSEETDLEYVYRCAVDLDFPEGVENLVYLDFWENYLAAQAKQNPDISSQPTQDTSHLVALQTRLTNERVRLSQAKSDSERALREVWVKQAERELEGEFNRLGMTNTANPQISDDELLSELGM